MAVSEYFGTYDAKSNVLVEDGALLVEVVSPTATASEIWAFTDGDTNVIVTDGALEIDGN